MTWDTDWSNGVSETITEIQSLASNQATDEANIAALQSAVNPIASSGTSSISVTASVIDNYFIKLFAIGTTNGGTSISLTVNSSTVLTFPAEFSGGTNQPFIMEITIFYDGGTMYLAPISPLDGDARMQVVSVSGSPSTLTFGISGTSWVGSFEAKFA